MTVAEVASAGASVNDHVPSSDRTPTRKPSSSVELSVHDRSTSVAVEPKLAARPEAAVGGAGSGTGRSKDVVRGVIS